MKIASAASRQLGGLFVVDGRAACASVRVALDRVGSGTEVPRGHQVRVDVVVGDRAVFVRPGDPVDPELPGGVVVAERAPQPRGLDEQLDPRLALERLVLGDQLVALHGVGDRRVDVERRRARRPVARALLAVRSSATETPRREARATARARAPDPASVAPAQRVRDRARPRVRERSSGSTNASVSQKVWPS